MDGARIIAFANQKGGVGKTTSCVNLAACLAAAEYKVLVVDLDPQANASCALGKRDISNLPSTYDVIIDDALISACVQDTDLEYLKIVVANQDLLSAEVELVATQAREQKLKKALQLAAQDFDFICIDCPPTLGLLTINALVAAESLVIPLQAERFALEALANILKNVDTIKKKLNKSLNLAGILLTMHEKSSEHALWLEELLRKQFQSTVFRTNIPRHSKVEQASAFGKPAILYDIVAPGSIAYMQAARELLERVAAGRVRVGAQAFNENLQESESNNNDEHKTPQQMDLNSPI